jgi:hypothetical protein
MKTSTRLHKLCSRALRAIDPQKLAGLLNEIDGIVAESITELNVMLKDCTEIGLRFGWLHERGLDFTLFVRSAEAGSPHTFLNPAPLLSWREP